MSRLLIAGAALLLAAAPIVKAGDEVDYSAPYLVVENGELVTKYPAKEHETGAAPAQESGSDPDLLAPGSDSRFRKTWMVAIIGIAAIAGFLLWARGRSQGDGSDDSPE